MSGTTHWVLVDNANRAQRNADGDVLVYRDHTSAHDALSVEKSITMGRMIWRARLVWIPARENIFRVGEWP